VAPFTSRLYVADSTLIKSIDAPQGSDWNLERLYPGLSFTRPTYLTNAADGTGRLFVTEMRGLIWTFTPPANPVATAPTPTVFLDITQKVHLGSEEGLFSIAFHPLFKQNGYVFAMYSIGTSYVLGAPDQVRVRIARFTLKTGNPNVLDPASEVVLLEVPKEYNNHNGGQIAFGPDHFLYASYGDGGCCGDPEKNAQDLTSLKGKILRIDVDGGSATLPYGIPADNPFVTTPFARGEIWAYGLRNPWRFSFDRKTGRLWAGDVGQDMWEEVDVITKGDNYGWSEYEGNHLYNGSVNAPNAVAPAIEYDHGVGKCVIGGYVYRGSRLPALQGCYIYGDYVTGHVWAASYDGTQVTNNNRLLNGMAPTISSFGEDESGELYIVSFGTGSIYRLAPIGGQPSAFPQTLSATGLFTNLATQTMRPEMIPYGVTEPLWSDFALKQRYMLLPHLDTIQLTPKGGWSFPADSILVKHFWLEQTRGDPTTKKIVETRLLIQTQGDWYGYSYEWNDQGTDATLLQDSKFKSIAVTVSGTVTNQDWYFPSRSDCTTCHTAAANFVLGPQTVQMNQDYDYTPWGGKVENQLTVLDRMKAFSAPLAAAPSSFPRLYAHTDPSATLDQKARSYFHANCAHCHQPSGGTPVNIDLRYDTALTDMGIVNALPLAGDTGVTGALIAQPQDPQNSLIWIRMTSPGANRMPALGSTVIDDVGAQLISDWINALP
jgi:uncharacterized repeat protein (TIGR03806 family)